MGISCVVMMGWEVDSAAPLTHVIYAGKIISRVTWSKWALASKDHVTFELMLLTQCEVSQSAALSITVHLHRSSPVC